MLETTPECVKIVSPDGKLVYMNQAGLCMVEADSIEAVLGAAVIEMIVPEYRDEWWRRHERVCRGERLDWQFEIIGAKGTRRWMETHAVPLPLPDGRVAQLAVTRDITGRKRSEVREKERSIELEKTNARLQEEIEKRRASSVIEARLGALVESSDDAIVGKTLEGIITSWNAGAESLFGYTPEEAVGQSILLIVPQERHGEEADILSRLSQGLRINHFETQRRRKDGSLVDISLSVSPIRDSTGTIVGASKIARDITEKKRIEREREQLLEAERTARPTQRVNRMKDEFLATLSHELRTPLNAIMGWAQLMGLGALSVDEMKDAGQAIERNARTQKQLIDDLLDMSRIISGKLRLDLQQIDPLSFVEAAIETIRPSAAMKEIRIEKLLDPRRPHFGRPRTPPAGGVEPALQRGQVHSQRREGAGPPRTGQFAHRAVGLGHRPGDRSGISPASFRAISPSRRVDDPPPRRAGNRFGHRQGNRGFARRHRVRQDPGRRERRRLYRDFARARAEEHQRSDAPPPGCVDAARSTSA